MSVPREVCLLIGRGGAVLWADHSGSPTALPDSRRRWDAIWSHREELEEIAHSHPLGPLAFSDEDASTMAALGAALGRTLRFSVVAPQGIIVCDAAGTRRHQGPEPFWAALLRLASGMPPPGGEGDTGPATSDAATEASER